MEIQTDQLIPARRPDQVMINKQPKKKERICYKKDFVVPENHRVKIKSEKINKYLDLAGELKKPWNIQVTVIPIVVNALGTVPKGLERR